MKNQLTFLVLLCTLFTTYSFSQSIDQEYIFSKEKYNRIYTAINVDGNTYLGGSMLTCQRGSVSAVSHDNNLLFSDTIPQDHDETFWHVSNLELRTSDSIIIGSGNWNITFDVGSPDIDGYYIFGMDLTGNKLFEKHLPGIYTNYHSLTLIPSGMLISTYFEIIWLDNVGEIQNTINYGLDSQLKDVDKLNADTLIAYSKNKILFMDYDGVVIDSVESSVDILDLYFDDEHIYCLRETDLMVYEINTSDIFYSTTYLSNINYAHNIIGNSNSVFIYGGDGYPNDEVVQLSKSDLSVLDDFSFDQEETEIEFIIATEDELQLIGYKDNYQSFIKSKTIANPLQYENIDIGISNIVPLDSLIVVDSMIPFGADEYLYEFEDSEIDFSFEVTNHGTEVITSFSLVADYSIIPFGCYTSLTTNYYDNLNILPSETITLTSSYDYHFYFLFQNSPVPEISVELFAPNHRFDSNILNNKMPGVTPILAVTEEINSLISSWELFPNPAHEYIYLNVSLLDDLNDVFISIHDAQGRKIMTKELISQGNIIQEKINTHNLINGLYWLSIHTQNDIQTKSFTITN